MKKGKDPLRTEAAIKKAVNMLIAGNGYLLQTHITDPQTTRYDLQFLNKAAERVAIADMRDLYRKRQPLRGITKAIRKAVQPRRKRK